MYNYANSFSLISDLPYDEDKQFVVFGYYWFFRDKDCFGGCYFMCREYVYL